MKKILISMMMLGSLGLFSCQDTFLQMPDTTGTVDLDEVYGSAKNAKSALMTCYRQALIHGMPGGWGVGHGTLGALCGEVSRGYSWHGTYTITQSGLDVNGTDGSDAGSEHFGNNWAYIRDCFLVKTNIDRVPDMTQEEKDYIKAEATALVAYRYMGMFYRYGGLPIVRKDFANAADPAVNVGRSSLEETLKYILELCDEAYDGLPEGDWSAADQGRMTRGAVLAIKARTLLFAARPLFNSATPYLSGEHNDLVCFGSSDENRWQQAIEANEAVLTWAAANNYALINTGAAGEGQPNPNAFDDYATATSTPANREVLLAYKNNDTNMWSWPASAIFYYNNYSPYWTNNRWDTDQSGLMTNFLEFYYKADGSDYANWPKVGDAQPRPIDEWLANIEAIEPRAKADNIFVGFDAFNNQGNSRWTAMNWNRQTSNASKDNNFPGAQGEGKGCAAPTKFYYKAGSRVWYEQPLFRMAEIYLNLAEAYNEKGNVVKALENLNKVHNRAGLPAIAETGQDALRKLIRRERAIEFYRENHRYYDVKHWKDENIANGIIGGRMRELQFKIKSDHSGSFNLPEGLESYWDAVAYESTWNPRMYLEPIPQSEINKGMLVQNPGY
ncbi:MAG: RagB/SusD family nutrient uptake outer membrane protein [Alistipes sp.]|nr:RagB/SusD family nutrient uptake outer membrane protein [Alistipes sp.]